MSLRTSALRSEYPIVRCPGCAQPMMLTGIEPVVCGNELKRVTPAALTTEQNIMMKIGASGRYRSHLTSRVVDLRTQLGPRSGNGERGTYEAGCDFARPFVLVNRDRCLGPEQCPLWIAFRTQVRHLSRSESCQKET
jgi:hypothetical protein